MEKKMLIDQITSWGANLVGVADTALLKGIETEPLNLLQDFPRAISIAMHLSDAVIDTITDRPTPIYSSHYSRVNSMLDDIALRTVNFLQSRNARAMPIPASVILDKEKWTSFISHKAVAIAAGIGWQGKSLLLVSPQFGPRVRLVTVLTDADLSPDDPLKNRCGRCMECRDHCPAGAIRGAGTDNHYATREEALYFDRCVHQVRDIFSSLPHIVPLICGVCISACPWGKSGHE